MEKLRPIFRRIQSYLISANCIYLTLSQNSTEMVTIIQIDPRPPSFCQGAIYMVRSSGFNDTWLQSQN